MVCCFRHDDDCSSDDLTSTTKKYTTTTASVTYLPRYPLLSMLSVSASFFFFSSCFCAPLPSSLSLLLSLSSSELMRRRWYVGRSWKRSFKLCRFISNNNKCECNKLDKVLGYCRKHATMVGHPSGGGRRCNREGCEKPVHIRGLCFKHGVTECKPGGTSNRVTWNEELVSSPTYYTF